MLKAIKELGELKLKREHKTVLNILTEDPNKDNKCPKALVLVLKEKDDKNLEYSHIQIEDLSKDKIDKYLYKRGASQGPDYTISSKITEIEKFFRNKVEGWFKKYSDKDQFLRIIKEAVDKSKEKIKEELKVKYNEVRFSIKKHDSCLFTLAIMKNENLRYIGEYKIIQDLLIESVIENYEKVSKDDHICSLCGEKKKVYGEALADVFKFYTLDKLGYIAGGFRRDVAWQNAPICRDCILYLKEGKKYLDEFLKYRMGGQTYYLIPKFLLGINGADNIIDLFFGTVSRQEEILKTQTLKRLSEDEKEILEELGKMNDLITFNFLFFASQNPQVFKINLLIEDVLPSRISEIFAVKKEVDKREFFTNIKVGEKYVNIEFKYDILRKFAPSYKSFLEVVDKTFRGSKINTELIFSWFMNKIREQFSKNDYLKILVLNAFVCYLFLERLKSLDKTSCNFKMGGEIMNDLKDATIENFFNDYSETFYHSALKAVFLLGVLCQKLLNIQFRERGSKPFLKKLKGLKMKEEDFKGLFPEIQNKLEEYKKNYYYSIESIISAYFVEAGSRWRISTDELNFYFVLGMNLHEKISEILKIKEEEAQSE